MGRSKLWKSIRAFNLNTNVKKESLKTGVLRNSNNRTNITEPVVFSNFNGETQNTKSDIDYNKERQHIKRWQTRGSVRKDKVREIKMKKKRIPKPVVVPTKKKRAIVPKERPKRRRGSIKLDNFSDYWRKVPVERRERKAPKEIEIFGELEENYVRPTPAAILVKNHFFDQVEKEWGCTECLIGKMNFMGTIKRDGLYEKWRFECNNCEHFFDADNSAKYKIPKKLYDLAQSTKRRYPVSKLNVQMVAGEIFTGSLQTELRDVFGQLGIHAPTPKSVNNLKCLVGEAFLEMCRHSERKWLEKEESLTMKLSSTKDKKLCVLLDGSWSKRGSGRAYNSPFGWVFGVGELTRKVVASSVMSKSCKMCEYHENQGTTPPRHDKCFRNHFSSSKEMETSGSIEIIQKIDKATELGVGEIGGDGDSTVESRLKKIGKSHITKREDANHFKGYLEGWLMDLKKEKYSKEKNILTQKQREQIKRYIIRILKSNRNKYEIQKKQLLEFVPYIFGDFDNSEQKPDFVLQQEKLKTSSQDEISEPSSLYQDIEKKLSKGESDPSKRHWLRFKGDKLRKDLQERVINRVIGKLKGLTNLSDTNANESANGVANKVQKKLTDNSRSGSGFYMISGAIGQFNEGSKFMNGVNKTLGLSGEEVDGKYFDSRQKQKERMSKYKKTPEFKAKRYQNKARNQKSFVKFEKNDDVHYSHGISFKETKKKFAEVNLDDKKQFHKRYGPPRIGIWSNEKKRKRYFDNEADNTFRNYEFDLEEPKKKRRKIKRKDEKSTNGKYITRRIICFDVEHSGSGKSSIPSGNDDGTKKLIQISGVDIETGDMCDVVFVHSHFGMSATIKAKIIPRVAKSKSRPRELAEGLKEFMEWCFLKSDGTKYEQVFMLAAAGKSVDYPVLEKNIKRVDDEFEKQKLERYFENMIKIDMHCLVGKFSVQKFVNLFRLCRDPSKKFKKLLSTYLYSIGEDVLHNALYDSWIEALIVLQIFSIKTVHKICEKYLKTYGKKCVGAAKKVRAKLKTEEFATFIGKLIEDEYKL